MTTDQKIVCGTCSASYRWKPELAGRKAKCKCGKAVIFPKDKPAPVVESGEMDLVPRPDLHEPAKKTAPAGPPCPHCNAKVAPNAIICTSCGTNLKTGKKVGSSTDKKSGKGMLLGVLVLLILGGGGAAAWYFFFFLR